MNYLTVDQTNIDQQHICCAIGNDRANQARSQSKKQWMQTQFGNGLVFRRLDQRGKVFIEYMPIENVWKPIVGKNLSVINCLWVSGQFKGKGLSTELLKYCIADAKRTHQDGIVAVSSARTMPFLTDRRFFAKHGFQTVDTAEPYFELLLLRINKRAMIPSFAPHAKSGTCRFKNGLFIAYSNQCPFMEEYVGIMTKTAEAAGWPVKVTRITGFRQAQQIGCPFGTFGLYANGRFVTHELMSEAKFKKCLAALEAGRG